VHETDMTKAFNYDVLRDCGNRSGASPDLHSSTVGKFTCVEPVSLQFTFEVQLATPFRWGKAKHSETPLVHFVIVATEYKPEIGIQYACLNASLSMEDIRSGRN